MTETNNQPIQAIVNAVKILDLINEKNEIGVREIAKILDIPKSTVFRIIKTLESQNLLVSTHEDEYAIGYKMLNYRAGINKEKNLITYATDSLKNFCKNTNETINLAIRNRDKTFIIYSEEGEYYSLQSNMLPESDLYCSSTGKIFMASMPEEDVMKYFSGILTKRTINTITNYNQFLKEKQTILNTDIAYDHEEYEYGLTCVATSIKVKDEIIAAISVSGPTTRLKVKGFENLEKELLLTAKSIEEKIIANI